MLLFINPTGVGSPAHVVININRVFEIVGDNCSLIINYDGGEYYPVENEKYVKKVDSVRVVFDSPDDVDKIFRQFYKAARDGNSVFFIGNSEEKKN